MHGSVATNGVRGKDVTPPQLLFYEDLRPDMGFLSREYEMTQEEMIEFASQYDPQSFHTDPSAARATVFGGLVASGWHTAAVTMRLVAESLPLAWGVVGAGTDHLSWPKPTKAGDRIRVRSTVETMRLLKSKVDRGMVVFRCTTLDQNDETLQVVVPKLFVPLRTHALPGHA